MIKTVFLLVFDFMVVAMAVKKSLFPVTRVFFVPLLVRPLNVGNYSDGLALGRPELVDCVHELWNVTENILGLNVPSVLGCDEIVPYLRLNLHPESRAELPPRRSASQKRPNVGLGLPNVVHERFHNLRSRLALYFVEEALQYLNVPVLPPNPYTEGELKTEIFKCQDKLHHSHGEVNFPVALNDFRGAVTKSYHSSLLSSC
mmetsp:Transcript_13673/g.27955  ORF Transcript_13673/g.27955 Transcript_13673/m.27955 type:complete len:202 (+) Transcript_13673:664-1269(+)